MKIKTRPRDAFDICLEVYKAARELVDERQPTSRLESSSKYLWRPDLRPRLVEFVSDFAIAGARALGEEEDNGRPLTEVHRPCGRDDGASLRSGAGGGLRLRMVGQPGVKTPGRPAENVVAEATTHKAAVEDVVATSSPARGAGRGTTHEASNTVKVPSTKMAGAPNLLKDFRPRRRQQRRASRLIFFRMHYLGGAEYETVRHFLGISEVNCADWVDEIKELVGRELMRRRIYPPGRYFRSIGGSK